VAIDLERVAVSAIEAALEGDEPQTRPRRHSGVKAIALDAALAAAGRLAATRGPKLGGASGLVALLRWARRARKAATSLPGQLRERLAGSDWIEPVRDSASDDAQNEQAAGGRAMPGAAQLLHPQEDPPVLSRAKRALGVDPSSEN
jgi:hypothetical protein